MPFWKQSEDPWDRKPEKRRPAPKEVEEPKKTILERLDGWQEDRRAAAKEKEDAKRLPPEPCPWCGKEMEQGYLFGGKGIFWYSGILTTRAAWIGDPSKERFRVDHEGALAVYKTTWLCRECKKLVFDMPEPETYESFTDRLEAEKTNEEEASEE